MFDNFQLIPAEAFTALGSFSEKLLDKISGAVGWVVIPKNTKKYRLEAEEYLIEQIKNNENIPVLVRASYISNARKIIKQYVNQCEICTEAINLLSTEIKNENIDMIEDDWLCFFFDKAKDVSKDDMKMVWSKLLAKKVENPNSVSKQLIHILSIIDSEEANAFMRLANFCINIGKREHVIITYKYFEKIYEANGLTQEDIMKLMDVGLIQCSDAGYSVTLEEFEKITYLDRNINVGEKRVLYMGNVALSKAGEELISIIVEKKRIEIFEKNLFKIFFRLNIEEDDKIKE